MIIKIKSCPKREALHDISEWLKSEKIPIMKDNYTVRGIQLDTKEQRELNRKLGLHSVNKTSKNMSRYKNK